MCVVALPRLQQRRQGAIGPPWQLHSLQYYRHRQPACHPWRHWNVLPTATQRASLVQTARLAPLVGTAPTGKLEMTQAAVKVHSSANVEMSHAVVKVQSSAKTAMTQAVVRVQ